MTGWGNPCKQLPRTFPVLLAYRQTAWPAEPPKLVVRPGQSGEYAPPNRLVWWYGQAHPNSTERRNWEYGQVHTPVLAVQGSCNDCVTKRRATTLEDDGPASAARRAAAAHGWSGRGGYRHVEGDGDGLPVLAPIPLQNEAWRPSTSVRILTGERATAVDMQCRHSVVPEVCRHGKPRS